MIFHTGRKTELKINPYEPCPCGSDKKFKFCCYQKARTTKFDAKKYMEYTDSRLNYEAKKIWEDSDFKKCLAFDEDECEGDIKNAHSIQNNRILNRISKDNHVYYIRANMTKTGPEAVLELISKNKASAFFGFCDKHDTQLFRPIEVIQYNNEPEQNFLFAFRAHAIEYHRKIRKFNHFREIIKINPGFLLKNDGVYLYRVHQFDVEDCEKDQNVFKSDFNINDFTRLRTIFRQLDYEIKFATSTSFTVQYDLEGNEINNIYSLDNVEMPSIYLNVYPVNNGTNIIISYHKKDEEKYNNYFNQLDSLSNEDLSKYLNYLIINYTENVFFHPDLIDNLTERQKKSLLDSFEASIHIMKKFELISEDNYFNFNLFESKDLSIC